MNLRINLTGDADHGWIGDVHDGNTHTVYNPKGADMKAALDDMLQSHFKVTEPAKQVEPPKPVAPATPATPPVAAKPTDPAKPAA